MVEGFAILFVEGDSAEIERVAEPSDYDDEGYLTRGKEPSGGGRLTETRELHEALDAVGACCTCHCIECGEPRGACICDRLAEDAERAAWADRDDRAFVSAHAAGVL